MSDCRVPTGSYKPDKTKVKRGDDGPEELWPCYDFECQSCGKAFWDSNDISYRFCPYCGREIKGVDDD